MKGNWKKLVAGLLVAMTIFIAGTSTLATTGTVGATTTYDYKWWALATIRNKLTTTYKSKSSSYSAYTTVDTFDNQSKVAVTHSFEDKREKSSSVSLGTKVTVKAIEVEAGADVKYTQTKTYSTKMSVPKRTKVTLKVRTKTEKLKYSSVVQRQDLYTSGKWKNKGASSTASSTQTVKSPAWVLK